MSSSKTKIIFTIPSFKTGGGTRVFVELANQLCLNFDVIILFPNNSDETNGFYLNPMVKTIAIGTFKNNRIHKLYNLIKTILHLNINHHKDIIIYTDPIFSLFAGLIRSKNTYRFVQANDYNIFDDGAILGDGIILKAFKLLTLKSYQNRKHKFIFNSRYVYDSFCKDSKRNDVAFNLVHPAIDHTVFNTLKKENNNHKPTIALVARKHPWKGLKTFIDAWNNIGSDYQNMVGKVILISHDDLSSFDLSHFELCIPTCDKDISNVYQNSDIFISTSWWEGFGLPPLEAMACGCSVICSDSGGVNEYAKNGENSLMFEPKNESQLQAIIIQLITNSTKRKQLSESGLLTAQMFSWEKSAEQLKCIIK